MVRPTRKEYPKWREGMAAKKTRVSISSFIAFFFPMSTKHTVLVAELVGGPDTAIAILPVHGINKAIRLGLLRVLAVVGGVAEESGRHAGPEGEDDEGQKVAHGHSTSAALVHIRAEVGDEVAPVADKSTSAVVLVDAGPRASGGDVEEDDEEENGAGNVNEGVGSVRPLEDCRMFKEPALNNGLDKDAQTLLHMDDLKGMFACGVDCAGLEGYSCEGTSELVDLSWCH